MRASVLLALVACASASVLDTLSFNFGVFEKVPLNQSAAVTANWTVVNTTAPCNEYGFQYRKQGRLSPTLMFNSGGFLIGYQVVLNRSTYNTTASNTGLYYIDAGEIAFMSVYFVPPAEACNAQPMASFDKVFAVLKGETITIPTTVQAFKTANPTWTIEGCFPSGTPFGGPFGMGQHFWRVLEPKTTTPCHEITPVFVYYDQTGDLVGVGAGLASQFQQSPTIDGKAPTVLMPNAQYVDPFTLWEVPKAPLAPYFFSQTTMTKYATCGQYINQYSWLPAANFTSMNTMHAFFRPPLNISCDSPLYPPTPAPLVAPTAPAQTVAPTAQPIASSTTAAAPISYLLFVVLLALFLQIE